MTTLACPPLDSAALVRSAAELTGIADPVPEYQPALERLIDSVNRQARPSPAGIVSVARSLTIALANVLALRRLQREHREVNRIQIERPVFITGLHRTGTTLLHSLLAADGQLRGPALWELLRPADTAPRTDLIEAARRYVAEYYQAAPRFRDIHPLDPLRGEECHRLTGNTFQSEIYGLRYRVPDYLDWLETVPATAAYQLHYEQLQAIIWRNPAGRLVLKCPFHLWHQDELAHRYPDARLIVLHRNPVQTLGSVCSLTATIRAARSPVIHPPEIGQYWLQRTKAAVELFLDSDRAGPLPTMHIRYPELIADPAAVLSRIRAFAELDRLPRPVLAQPAAGGGRHRYRLDDFGLQAAVIERVFADYRRRWRL